MRQEHLCLWGGPWAVPSPGTARPGLSTEGWQSVLGCCCCCAQHRAGQRESAQCQWSCIPRGSPAHAEGKRALSVQSSASSAVSLLPLLPFLPSPERDSSSTVKLPHSQPAVSPSAAGLCYWVNGLFPEIHWYLGAHIISMCRKLS